MLDLFERVVLIDQIEDEHVMTLMIQHHLQLVQQLVVVVVQQLALLPLPRESTFEAAERMTQRLAEDAYGMLRRYGRRKP